MEGIYHPLWATSNSLTILTDVNTQKGSYHYKLRVQAFPLYDAYYLQIANFYDLDIRFTVVDPLPEPEADPEVEVVAVSMTELLTVFEETVELENIVYGTETLIIALPEYVKLFGRADTIWSKH